MMPRWTIGVEDKERVDAIQLEYECGALLRERLAELLQDDVDKSLTKMRAFVDQGHPNLTVAYASELAKQKIYLDIINLIK